MPSHYTVVRYVPDPVAEERINIGVVVTCDEKVYSRFVDAWERVAAFGNEDIQFLRDFAGDASRNIRQAISSKVSDDLPFSGRDLLRQMAGRWINSIQFSEPHASVLPPSDLLDQVATRFLRMSQRSVRVPDERRSSAPIRMLPEAKRIDNWGEVVVSGTGYWYLRSDTPTNLQLAQTPGPALRWQYGSDSDEIPYHKRAEEQWQKQ